MFDYNPAPLPKHNRRAPKRAARTAFSKATREAINDRDRGLCILCHKQAAHIHHIEYRSSLSEDCNTKKNGASLCIECHDLAHRLKQTRELLRWWKANMLDSNGDLIEFPIEDDEPF